MTKTQKKSKTAQNINTALSGYLVVWRHNMDDVPVGLFSTKAAAIDYAEKMTFRAGYAAARRLDIDCRTPVCFAVVEFDHGKPTGITIVDRDDDSDSLPPPLPR